MFIDNDIKLDYSDVLMVPRDSHLSSRSQINLEVDHFDSKVIPVMAANMDGVGTFEMARELNKHKIMTALIKHYNVDELVDFFANEGDFNYAAYTMGIRDEDYNKWVEFANRMSDLDGYAQITVSIDVANGYTYDLERYLENMRENFPDVILMVGNVVTPERVECLIDRGADIVKIGVGPGSVCTTRTVTGVGYPQFSAVLECAAAADSAGASICADGGITCSGDAAKAFAAGAKYVMIGGLFAGHLEGLSTEALECAKYQGLRGQIPWYGMASKEAQSKYSRELYYRAPEGKEVQVPYRGAINDVTIPEFLGGLRSACTYVGASGLDDIHRRARFIKVNRQLNGIYS